MIGSDQATRPGRPRRCPSLRRAVARSHVLNHLRRVSATAIGVTCWSDSPACTWSRWSAFRRLAGEGLVVTVESPPGVVGCAGCGVVARSHGRRTVELVDAPCFGRPVTLRWRKRTWTCPDRACPVGTFTEQDPQVGPARALLTARATEWAIAQL